MAKNNLDRQKSILEFNYLHITLSNKRIVNYRSEDLRDLTFFLVVSLLLALLIDLKFRRNILCYVLSIRKWYIFSRARLIFINCIPREFKNFNIPFSSQVFF